MALEIGSVHIYSSKTKVCKNVRRLSYFGSTIPPGYLEECKNLSTVDLTDTTDIPAGLFRCKSKLTRVDADVVRTIGDCAFEHCENLQHVQMSNVRKIGSRAFAGCVRLQHIEVAPDVVVETDSFDGCACVAFAAFATAPCTTTCRHCARHRDETNRKNSVDMSSDDDRDEYKHNVVQEFTLDDADQLMSDMRADHDPREERVDDDDDDDELVAEEAAVPTVKKPKPIFIAVWLVAILLFLWYIGKKYIKK